MVGSKKETLNKPILGSKNYGERLVLCYLYDDTDTKGYVLKWVLSGDNNVNHNNNTIDITHAKHTPTTSDISDISDISKKLREGTTTIPDANTPDATSETTTVPDATRDSIESVEYERRPEIRLGGKRLKKSRTTRRKSRKSGGKRRSRRGSRTK